MVKGDRQHTGPMETLDAFHQKMKIVKLVNDTRRPLPTTFKQALCVSVSIELLDLARTLKSEHNVRISEELEPVIRNRLIKLAHQINKKMRNGQ